jgi:hypothetical protein
VIPAVVLGLFGGGEPERLRERLERTPAASPGTVSPGPVAVEGVAREHRERVPEPAGDGEAFLLRYRRYRRVEDGREADGPPVEQRTEAVPFVVEGEDGRVLVDPREAVEDDGNYALFSERNTRRYRGEENPATAVLVGEGDEDGSEDQSGEGEPGEWVHVQSGIRPGDRVFVVGEATATPGGSPPFVVGAGDDGGFLVSDLSRAAVREQLARESGPFDGNFWRIALLGVIAILVVAVVLVAAVAIANVFLF